VAAGPWGREAPLPMFRGRATARPADRRRSGATSLTVLTTGPADRRRRSDQTNNDDDGRPPDRPDVVDRGQPSARPPDRSWRTCYNKFMKNGKNGSPSKNVTAQDVSSEPMPTAV